MSSTMSSCGSAQEMVLQPASATDILVEEHLGLCAEEASVPILERVPLPQGG